MPHGEKNESLIEQLEEMAEEVEGLAEEISEVAWEEMSEMEVEVEDAARKTFRVLAYTARVNAIAARSALTTFASSGALRYLAFTSDFGEAFRPAVPPGLVNAAYGLSVAYIVGAIVESGYEVRKRPWPIITETVAHETSFQLVASLLVPFLFIHTAVHKTASILKARGVHKTRPLVAKWGPSAVGLVCVPVMPLCVDKPCEYVVDEFFDKAVKPFTRSWAADAMKQQNLAEKKAATVQQYIKKVE
eukprot:NODE_8586_length_1484_cov_3.745763.p1 GENE.NODE_8586_length_1484_cov_3.745763~~NODE_8586_length_1484_cov_3.745763.p1  ORF type:complete len:246 (+),score=88.20 NODE_8586_length_1484_cov_3.745763:106-843(+)